MGEQHSEVVAGADVFLSAGSFELAGGCTRRGLYGEPISIADPQLVGAFHIPAGVCADEEHLDAVDNGLCLLDAIPFPNAQRATRRRVKPFTGIR